MMNTMSEIFCGSPRATLPRCPASAAIKTPASVQEAAKPYRCGQNFITLQMHTLTVSNYLIYANK